MTAPANYRRNEPSPPGKLNRHKHRQALSRASGLFFACKAVFEAYFEAWFEASPVLSW
jgi:hypothetical protein